MDEGIIYVPCSNCETMMEIPESEWTPRRKPRCVPCKLVRPLGSFSPRSEKGYDYTDKKRREQRKSESYWRKREQLGKQGIIRVVSDWKEI